MIPPISFSPAMPLGPAGKPLAEASPKRAEADQTLSAVLVPVPPSVESRHSPVLWPSQIDPVAVHTAVLIAQEAYRNQKALESLAMLVHVPSGTKSDVPVASRPGARGEVRPPLPGDSAGEGGFRR